MNKNFYLLITAFLFNLAGFGQISNVTVTDGGMSGCASKLNVTLTNGPVAETDAVISVYWIGLLVAPETLNVNLAPNQTATFTFSKEYNGPGTTNVNVSAFSAVNQATVGPNTVIALTVPTGLDCGRTELHTRRINYTLGSTNGYIYYEDVPYDFENESGVITTIYPDSNNIYRGLELNHYYDVDINPAWLAQHNLIQLISWFGEVDLTLSNNQYLGEINGGTMGTTATFDIECNLGCGRTKIAVYDYILGTGYSNVPFDFTDINGNTETLIPGSNGFYSGFNQHDGEFIASVNDAWLTLNNFSQVDDDLEIDFSVGLQGQELSNPLQNYMYIKPANCGMFDISTINQAYSINYSTVPYDFTSENGTITTLYPSSNGYYILPEIGPGNEIFTISINSAWLDFYPDLSPITPNMVINLQGQNLDDPLHYNFYVHCNTVATLPDFGISDFYTGILNSVQGAAILKVGICNYACDDTSNVHVKLKFPASIISPSLTGLTNAVISGDTLEFDVENLAACTLVKIPITFPVSTPSGTNVDFFVTLSDLEGTETVLANNEAELLETMLNSYDPNMKHVNKPLSINPAEAEELQYDIHFQNEGNFSAYRVVVEDTISGLMDLSTFRLLETKHPVSYSINPANRLVTFTFNNIMLKPKSEDEEGSKGYIIYSIEENEGLPVWSEIENTAYIYFDFNPAIVTNTTSNINSLAGIEEQSMSQVSLYPNPAGDVVHIQAEGLKSVQVIDFTGKCIVNSGADDEISTSALADGIYLVKIATSKGLVTKKLVIRK